jgi:class 3 adenylate cyclase
MREERYFKSLRQPDERIDFPGIVEEILDLGDVTVGRVVSEPGWRWSTHVRPEVGTERCEARHVGVVVSGRFGVLLRDGTRLEMGPYDVYDIPPGHDGWTVGDQPLEVIEWTGLRAFAGFRGGSRAVLATLVFTDMVDSTATATRLGEAAWKEVLSTFLEGARVELERHRGRELRFTGDGLITAFEGAGSALRCAVGMRRAARRSGLRLRTAVHAGEVEFVKGDVRGLAAHVAARILSLARADEILVSEATRALNPGLAFAERGTHALKGLAGEWKVFAYAAAPDGDGP